VAAPAVPALTPSPPRSHHLGVRAAGRDSGAEQLRRAVTDQHAAPGYQRVCSRDRMVDVWAVTLTRSGHAPGESGRHHRSRRQAYGNHLTGSTDITIVPIREICT
jgi:hypothetical protein